MPIDTLATWYDLAKRKDAAGLDALLADDVVFHSPVVHTPQSGKAITKAYLSAALSVLNNESFRYVREVRGNSEAVLEFVVNIDEVIVNGVDIVRWNERGQIVEFKVMLRPLKGIDMVHQKMAAMLDAMKGRA
jgi:ketosteroid isomerase-like protein